MSLRDDMIRRLDLTFKAESHKRGYASAAGFVNAPVAVDALHVVELVEALEQTTFCLNSTRLIMSDKETRDFAGEIVDKNKALLSTIKQDG